jgi:hypothetical protein
MLWYISVIGVGVGLFTVGFCVGALFKGGALEDLRREQAVHEELSKQRG